VKVAILLLAVSMCACGQKKATRAPKAVETPKSPDGMACSGQDFRYSFTRGPYEDQALFVGATGIAVPASQVWKCVDGKWRRDMEAEVRRDEHTTFVSEVRSLITTQKLTPDQIEVIEEAIRKPFYGGFTCSPRGCEADIERLNCFGEAASTADLIAQLSFWKPTEEELPLTLLESFVKGSSCEAGSLRAYEIINQRIISYLKGRR
jgi:hypothetical protein